MKIDIRQQLTGILKDYSLVYDGRRIHIYYEGKPYAEDYASPDRAVVPLDKLREAVGLVDTAGEVGYVYLTSRKVSKADAEELLIDGYSFLRGYHHLTKGDYRPSWCDFVFCVRRRRARGYHHLTIGCKGVTEKQAKRLVKDITSFIREINKHRNQKGTGENG